VDFGELNDKAIKGLMNLSKIVSRFYLYIHEQPLEYLFVEEYYMSHIDKDKYMVQDFMCLLKENKIMKCKHYGSKLKLAHSLSIKIKHLKRGFQMKDNCI
jgi:5-bromo-4-chloroindolyl phosphate hydrolysis protein